MASSSIYVEENPSNPFYLHHGDSPGSILVSQPLIGDNYHIWSRSMIIALTAKNKIGFIDGTLVKPSNPSYVLSHTWSSVKQI